MKITRILILISIGLAAAGCVNTDSENCQNSTDYTLARAESSDYSTYKLDLIKSDSTVSDDVISISSSGIKDVELFTDSSCRQRLIVMNSKSSGGSLLVYSLSDFSNAEASVTVDNYGQEFAFAGTRIFYAVQNENKVKTLDFSDLNNINSTPVEIPVGKKPTNVRYVNTRIYVTNQDFTGKTQSTVSVINPSTLKVEKTINVGENPSDLAYHNNSLFSYNSKWFGGSTASISYNIEEQSDGTTAPTVDLSGASNSEVPAFGGMFARTNSSLYVLLSSGSGFFRYRLTTSGVSERDDNSGSKYLWIGSHPTEIYKAYEEGGNLKISGGSLSSAVDLGSKQSSETFFVLN